MKQSKFTEHENELGFKVTALRIQKVCLKHYILKTESNKNKTILTSVHG